MAQQVVGGVVGQKGHAGVREHAEKGGGEASVEVHEAGARGCRGSNDCGLGSRHGRRWSHRSCGGVFAIDLRTDAGE